MKPRKETTRVEGRDQPEGGLREGGQDRTQSRKPLLPHLMRVREAARRGRKTRFTALLHHVDFAALFRAFCRLKRGAAAGVDGETVASYEEDLAETTIGVSRSGRPRAPGPLQPRAHGALPAATGTPGAHPQARWRPEAARHSHSHRELHIVPTSRRDGLRSPTRSIHSAGSDFRS